MDSAELERRLQLLLEAAGYHLISAYWKPLRGKLLLRVVADAEDHNINVDECADLSRAISDLLDSYPHEFPDYRLEVSSPGLNRPLESWQFPKNIGRKIEVRFRESGDQRTHRGELIKADAGGFTVRGADGERRFKRDEVNEVYVLPSLSKS